MGDDVTVKKAFLSLLSGTPAAAAHWKGCGLNTGKLLAFVLSRGLKRAGARLGGS